MEDEESLVFSNVCNECGLPMKIHSFEIVQIKGNDNPIVKLFCQNLQHKAIIRISFEEYQSIIDESFENICKCTLCNKFILEKSIIPYYCYTCKKIICSDCLNNKHEKDHKNFFNYNELKNKCLIHPNDGNNTDFYCPICKNNYCQKCKENGHEHAEGHKLQKTNDYSKEIKENINEIKIYNLRLINNKEKLLEKLKNLNILINFNDYLLKEKNKNIHLLNDYKENSKIIQINKNIENYIYNENKIEVNKYNNKDNNKKDNKEDNKEDNKVDNKVDNKIDNKEKNKENNNKNNNIIINSKDNKMEINKEKQYNEENNKNINIDNQVNNKDENKEKNNENNKEKSKEKIGKNIVNKEDNKEDKQESDKEDNKNKVDQEINIEDNKKEDNKENSRENIKNKMIEPKKKNKENNINEGINIIYYDENVNDNSKMHIIDDCCKLTIDTNGSIIFVNDKENFDLLIKNLKKYYPNSKFFFIVNGKSSKNIISFIKTNNYNSLFIKAYIYTGDIKKYASIQKDNPDFIEKVEDNIDKITEFIKNEFKQNGIKDGKIYINSLINYIFYKNDYFPLHKELSNFYGDETEKMFKLYFPSIKEYIENLNLSKDDKDNLIKCFEIFSELQNKNYEKIIICYLKEYTFSNFLNSLLKKKDLSIFKKIGYFAGNLMHSIVEYGKNEDKGVNSGEAFYKGMELNIIDLLEYLKNRGYPITFPYFFTISDSKEFAEITSKRNKSKEERRAKGLYSVIMEIKYLYDEGYEPCIYNLKDLCQYPDEEEFIILPFTFLILKKVEIDSKQLIANLKLEVIGKMNILEKDIKESKSIEFDEKNKIMFSK